MRIIPVIIIAFTLSSCARQTQPGGGPKDKEAPELLSSTPENGQKNFHGTSVELYFDEFIKLKDAKEEILIMPSLGSNTKITAKKNRVVIIPEFKLKDTTTYSIAFRNGIQDLNESNPAEDLHLAFSTGPTIDSLQLFGKISEVFKDKPPQKITVALYQTDTFDIFLDRPILFTKSDKKGRFVISNLKPGNYYIYAFDDVNKNQKVDSKTERFGFLTKEINLPQNTDSIRIELIHLDSRPIKLTSVRNSSTTSTIRFNKNLDSLKLSANIPIIYTYGDNRSEVLVYKDEKDLKKEDSLKVNVLASDSLYQKLDTAVYVKFSDNKAISSKFKLTDWQVRFDANTNILTAEATSNKLLSLNFDSIYIQIDTSKFQSITPKEVTFDTLTKQVRIETKLDINPKETIPNPVLLLGKGAVISIDSDSSKSQDIKIKIPRPDDTGTVSIEIDTKEKHFQIILTTADGKPVKTLKDVKSHIFTMLPPAEYRVTILIDSNNNGRWDSGDFHKRIEPEKVKLYQSLEKKYTFPVRANWELGPLVISF